MSLGNGIGDVAADCGIALVHELWGLRIGMYRVASFELEKKSVEHFLKVDERTQVFDLVVNVIDVGCRAKDLDVADDHPP